MPEFFSSVLNIATLVFAVSSMLSVGLANSFRRILGPLRNMGAVFRVLLANFVLVPLLAFVLLQVIALEGSVAEGLVLVSMAAGAPFLVKLSETAETDVGLSATVLIILLPATIVYMPLMVPRISLGLTVDAGAIARPLMVTMLLPLTIGLVLRALAESAALRVQPWLAKLATIALVVLIAATIVANFGSILTILHIRPLAAAIVLIAGAFVIGFLLGGRNRNSREVLGLATAQRNISAALVVATQTFHDPTIVAMVVITSLAGFAVLFPTAFLLRRHSREHAAQTAPDQKQRSE